MIGMAFSAALAISVPHCAAPSAGEVLVTELPLDMGGGRIVQAAAFQHLGRGPRGIDAVRVTVYSSKCDELYEQKFEFSSNIVLKTTKLGDVSVLVATVLSPGGSGCGLQHVILDFSDALDPEVISPARLGHSNMGGMFVGDLGQKQGPGLVIWDAVWNSGSHYDPHPYRVLKYKWSGDHFIGPVITTTMPMQPDPAEVAKALGFPYSLDMSIRC